MREQFFPVLIGLAVLLTTVGCRNQTPKSDEVAPQGGPTVQQPASKSWTGTVVETMNAGGYTYVLVDAGSQKVWVAGPEVAVKVGDTVYIPQGMPMANFHSKTLNRDFEMITFVDSIRTGEAAEPVAQQAPMPPAHPAPGHQPGERVDFSGIRKAEGGKTVAEVYASRTELSGKEIKIRGKVVKFSPQILGKNWIHLRDGTGDESSNDLTITTDTTAKVGDTVLVTGPVTTGKDFGYGYKFDVMVENARVVVE